ncbi:MAG TPA: thioredoxin family protein [Pyrinomonadaceae bacterium]|nr:thioredoxin family protein [Pyrinomonadaceae bacterium]
MRNRRFVVAALSLLLAASAITPAHATNPGGTGIGQPVADFKLPDTDGKERSLASLKGEKGTVIIFISAQCPMVRAYNERIEKLAQDYRAKGVNVVGINSNVTESADDIKRHISDNSFSFVVLRDKGSKIADMLGAERTPEVFLLDASNKLVYRGRIDNHRDVALVQTSDLRNAIEETLAGKSVTKTEAAAFGCTIKRG